MIKWLKKFEMNISLMHMIRISFILAILLITTVYLIQSYSYTELLQINISENLERQIRKGVYEHLDSYLQMPKYVNQINLGLANTERINLYDPQVLAKIFLNEVVSNDRIDYVYYANESGGIVSVGNVGGQFTLSLTENMTAGDFVVKEINRDGEFQKTIKTVTDFDPRSRTWYEGATDSKASYWSEVYTGASENLLGITASEPLFDEHGNVIGVFGADILLDSLSDYLRTLKTSPNGSIYLLETDGKLIASATAPANNNQKPPEYGPVEMMVNRLDATPVSSAQIDANASADAVLKGSWQIIEQSFHQNPPAPEISGKYEFDQKNYYLDISRYSYDNQVHWYLVIAIPQKDFDRQTNLLWYSMVLSILFLLFLGVIFAVLLSRRVLHPIRILTNKVLDIRNGNWGAQIDDHRSDELGQLAESFNEMSCTIKASYDALVRKNTELAELNTSLEERVKLRTDELRTLSITDELTGLYNHRFILEKLRLMMDESQRCLFPLSIALLDIDFFKKINDHYGHLEGNNVLIALAQCLKANIRGLDTLGRYGGEEFLLILPNTTGEDAFAVTDRLRNAVAQLRIGDHQLQITLSGGVAVCDTDDLNEFIRRADQKLYQAKEAGRNRIMK